MEAVIQEWCVTVSCCQILDMLPVAQPLLCEKKLFFPCDQPMSETIYSAHGEVYRAMNIIIMGILGYFRAVCKQYVVRRKARMLWGIM